MMFISPAVAEAHFLPTKPAHLFDHQWCRESSIKLAARVDRLSEFGAARTGACTHAGSLDVGDFFFLLRLISRNIIFLRIDNVFEQLACDQIRFELGGTVVR
jgi:hypothetical protein